MPNALFRHARKTIVDAKLKFTIQSKEALCLTLQRIGKRATRPAMAF
jgi:hypothetical protein